MKPSKQPLQKGFTLVEIAIVLVIVGLLLGAVLKGQELIFNSKVKATFTMSKEMAAAVYSFQDRYKVLPGDDNVAATRFPTATPVPANGNGDGNITWQTWPCVSASNGENCQSVYHLRLSGFISGNGAEAPMTSFGGRTALAGANAFSTIGSTSPAFAMEPVSLSHKAMSMMDSNFDDGVPSTGSIRCRSIGVYNMTTLDANVPDWCSIPL